jgi:hypothetical protein
MKEIVDSGELGTLTKIEANLAVGSGFVKDNDIRMVYDLGGGAMMDMGCEFFSTIFPHLLRISSQATHCPYRGTCQVPTPQRSSVPSQTYFQSSLRSIPPPPLRLHFPPREEVLRPGLLMG